MKKFTESVSEGSGSRDSDGNWVDETPQAKLRNQLSPFWTLSSLLDEDEDVLKIPEMQEIIKSLVKTCESNKEIILALIKETEK